MKLAKYIVVKLSSYSLNDDYRDSMNYNHNMIMKIFI